MRWQFHGLIIEGTTNDATLAASWRQSFASRPASTADPDLCYHLDLVDQPPEPPSGAPQFRQGDLLAYYLDGETAVAHFPRFGRLQLNLARGVTEGQIVPAALRTYGVLEDIIAIGLSPHLRRRGLFLLHAFAAASYGRAALLVGGIGAGKTTTGMALLDAGWQLLSNDSPVVNEVAEVLSYPGVLAAYPDTLARFAATAHLATTTPGQEGRPKIVVPAESLWPGVWLDKAPAGAIFFPQIEARSGHALEPLTPPEALRRLLPHAVEQWDRPLIPRHLAALRRLVEAAPAYTLRLGPEVAAIPPLLASVLQR
ncbi:MAG: hypothetical protein L0332_23460 [Chloroflexi bacterium]|nr:hypothetical protein [Chloroflexota bacterium]MCI0580509.1 hypothetical protein [Chloroflexota bacterium]MCI0643560.1 hypothetical protein [Chloroflexota bacterium]MCI0729650.1 hypothetical protein [Chloroflexota bacterium]